MIGLELGVSVASAALRGEPTGAPTGFRSDVVATAKRDLEDGEMLDGEGGFCVWGKQTPAERSLAEGFLPLGLAARRQAQARHRGGEPLTWSDVAYDETDLAVKVRREMEAAFGRGQWRPSRCRDGLSSRFARRLNPCRSPNGSCRAARTGSARTGPSAGTPWRECPSRPRRRR